MSLRDELVARFPALAQMPGDAFVVGGAIRDLLLGREPADVDVTCLEPEAAARLVRSRVIRLGTADELSAWRVVNRGHAYDFAPTLGDDIETDLRRRDCTINAMAVRLSDGALLDPHDGQGDLKRKLVRMVRAENFDDDPLRVLKGIRLAVRLGFELDETTLLAMKARADRINEIAAERVTYELDLIVSAGELRKVAELLRRTTLDRSLGLMAGEFQADEVTAAAAYALMVGDVTAFARRWRWSSAREREVRLLQRLRSKHRRIDLYDAGEEVARQLPGMLRAVGLQDTLDWPDFAARPLLNGEEIGSLTGLPPGRRLGVLVRSLLEAQIAGDVTDRVEAEAFVLARTSD